ncbi:MAG: hypothetical protein WC683_04335 [bacterium]
MKATLESTSKIVHLNGVPARIWEGETESGIPIHCYITRVAVAEGADSTQFQLELDQVRSPSPEVAAIPLRLIL